MSILNGTERCYKGEVVTASLLNDLIETAGKAYNMCASALLSAYPLDWDKLRSAFSVNGNGQLILRYDGDNPGFSLDAAGNLKLTI